MDSGHLIFKQCCSKPVVLLEAIYFSSNESVLLLPIETHSPSLVITLHLSHSGIAASLLEFLGCFSQKQMVGDYVDQSTVRCRVSAES